MRRSIGAGCAVTLVLVAGCLRSRVPSVDSPAYEQTTRSFYRGLAELQVGLLDGAKTSFGKATEFAPGEPAAWANLGLSSLRLGQFQEATAPIDKAISLDSNSSELIFLRGRLLTSQGKLDEGIADYRRAAQLDPGNMRVRYALAEELERAGNQGADAEAQQLFETILKSRPGNVAVILERARLAAKRSDTAALRDSVQTLQPISARWPSSALEQFRALQIAVAGNSIPDAQRSAAFLRNVLVRDVGFRENLAAVRTPTELIAEPFETFLKMPSPSSKPSPPDEGLTFTSQPFEPESRLSGRTDIDWNRDFKMDYAVADKNGIHLFEQVANDVFKDATPKGERVTADCFGVWAADIEMDGDVDLIAGVRGAAPIVLRNNGDGSWKQLTPFAGVIGLRAFAWADVDGDGDPDAVLVDEHGDVHVFENRQAGEFREFANVHAPAGVVAVAIGDVDGDGRLGIVTLDRDGAVRRTRYTSDWQTRQIARWPDVIAADAVGEYRIFLEDFDNNGAIDVAVSGGGKTRVWIGDTPIVLPVETFSAVDHNNDGVLDLQGQSTWLLGKGTKGYHWQVLRPRAQPTAGDRRVNSFGVGGEIEIRSGLLTQKQVITNQSVHFGLGTRTGVDVARIFWPNGIMQADFDTKADATIVAEQRLKGSCPWVFAYDGHGMRFVTDFLWRSPLGLRINAIDTAGVTQTEDWVKIRGDQLVPRDGQYDVRITAELWETHFFDYVALLVVDHPDDQEVFVDERFARQAPSLAVHALTNRRPVQRAWDDAGRDVTGVIAARDGRYLATFERGPYQGVAKEHFVEVDLGEGERHWLVANGWIYPTDSSINVAIGQQNLQTHGLSLEAQDARGHWRVIAPDLGFPEGKNKTMLIDLSAIARAGIPHARRIRLRTNLEVYWDQLSLADGAPDAARLTQVRVQPASAELRFRGFSKTDVRRDAPETPRYDEVANVTQRWRDLIGYYTRFGDVRELLSKVDDRYVIMNAGDELRLSFPAPPPPDRGWTRDFVLIGDGWEKDGDYNTTASQTVEPLPQHGHATYDGGKGGADIETDPVYRAHPEDWQTYHTRFVDPRAFLNGLR